MLWFRTIQSQQQKQNETQTQNYFSGFLVRVINILDEKINKQTKQNYTKKCGIYFFQFRERNRWGNDFSVASKYAFCITSLKQKYKQTIEMW